MSWHCRRNGCRSLGFNLLNESGSLMHVCCEGGALVESMVVVVGPCSSVPGLAGGGGRGLKGDGNLSGGDGESDGSFDPSESSCFRRGNGILDSSRDRLPSVSSI